MSNNIQKAPNLISIKPNGDNRTRVYGSERLWVISRSYTKDKSKVTACGAIESIERVVLGLDGKAGKFVRYEHNYHRLHSPEEFSELLDGARRQFYSFFNNATGCHEDPIRLTSVAPFIYMDEIEAPYF
jgi:hypothetical protein